MSSNDESESSKGDESVSESSSISSSSSEVKIKKKKKKEEEKPTYEDDKNEDLEELLAMINELSLKVSGFQRYPYKKTTIKRNTNINEADQLKKIKDKAQKLIQKVNEEKERLKGYGNPQPYKGDTIKLQIADKVFEIKTDLLLKKDPNNLFQKLILGQQFIKMRSDGVFFFDRDPVCFEYIVNYFNDKLDSTIPHTTVQRTQLAREALFFELHELLRILHGKVARERNLGIENVTIRDQENQVKQKFLEGDQNVFKDPYYFLVDVFKEKETFKCAEEQENSDLPLIMDTLRNMTPGQSSIVGNIDLFKQNFYNFAPHLEYLNWKNLFVAGGSVLSSLIGDTTTFGSSDVDLFIYGLDKEEAKEKIKEIYHSLKRVVPEMISLRTNRTITFISGYPYRHVQIVLRLYNSPAEVILGFDLDCVAVGFDGANVYCLPRARRAINYRYNIADPTKQTYRTTSYEYRLWKYSKRGFAVAIPGFRLEHITFIKNTTQFRNSALSFKSQKGLARLLYFNKLDKDNFITQTERRRFIGKEDKNPATLIDEDVKVNTSEFNLDEIKVDITDYSCGTVVPFNSTTTIRHLSLHLEWMVDWNSQVEDEVIFCNFVFGKDIEGLETIFDAHNFYVYKSGVISRLTYDSMPKDEKYEVNLRLPRHIEFIGSLQEYLQSLPDVEDDWYKCATGSENYLL